MTVFRTLLLACVLLCAGALAAPGAASAASTASVSGGVLAYVASGPDSNSVTITSGDGAIVIADQGVQAVVPGAGCSRLTARQVSCPSAGVTALDIDAGPGDDTVSVALFFTPATVHGGAGNDTITGGAANDDLNGDAGLDSLAGGWGDDRLDGGYATAEADRLVGNGGVDSVSYAGRSAAVDVSLDGVANDGEAGEGDNVEAEHLIGGAGADTLSGDGDANSLAGGAGSDSLSGGSGADALDGGAGADEVAGGPGADAIAAREGEADAIGCGSEGDSVVADSADSVASDCESVDKPGVAPPQPPVTAPPVAPPPVAGPGPSVPPPPGPPVAEPQPEPLLTDAPGVEIGRLASVTHSGAVAIVVTCPAAAADACSGTLMLALPEETYVAARSKTAVAARRRRVVRRATRGRRKFNVAPGTQRTVSMQLTASVRRTVRRRGRLHVVAMVADAGGAAKSSHPLTLTLERRAARRR